MIANDDFYNHSHDPDNKVNPKIVGAMWINNKTGKIWICKDNTLNNNIWELCNPDIVIPPPPEPVGLGIGQKWYNMAGQRVANVWYTNDTGKPIMILADSANNKSWTHYYIDDKKIFDSEDGQEVCFVVPPGSKYKFTGGSYYAWWELR